MFHQPANIHLEWIRLAEESLKKGDYEAAANHMRRVAHYFRFNEDMTEFREYIRKTGDCYLRAAEKLRNSGQCHEAPLLYIKAAECYKEIGDYTSSENCSLTIRKYYATIVKDSLTNSQTSPLNFKKIGDYFRGENDIEKARECYEASARKAEEEGNLILAGGLYRDAGECSSLLKDVERAAENYARAADNYFKAEEYFEAAWHYNISGFLLISLEKFYEASLMAERAKDTCSEGNIFILLDRLSIICELLSRSNYYAAEGEWQKIKRKFKKNYADLIDLCFEKAKKARP